MSVLSFRQQLAMWVVAFSDRDLVSGSRIMSAFATHDDQKSPSSVIVITAPF
jgi:hypothetical protein